jgi:hypothetical protein
MVTEETQMSTAIPKMEPFRADVMVRAFAGEPVRLTAVGKVGKTAIEVVGNDEEKSIGFPARDVFRFDQGLFRELLELFQSGRSDALMEVWNRASPIAR